MTIKKLVSNGDIGIKNATITLSYEECRDLANSLCEYLDLARENKDIKTLNRYKDIYKKVNKLFRLVKSGWLLDEDIEIINHVIKDIEEAEVDVVEQKHGHWIWDNDEEVWKCSVCALGDDFLTNKYCKNCGAIMDEETGDND